MPRVSKRRPRTRAGITDGHLYHLLTGHDWLGDGFGNGWLRLPLGAARDAQRERVLADMREAWADPSIRQRVFALLDERHASGHTIPAAPWAATAFDTY